MPVIPVRLLLSLRKSHDCRAESERVEKSTQVLFLYVMECRARKVLAVPNAEKQQAVAFLEAVLFILEEEPLWFGAIALPKNVLLQTKCGSAAKCQRRRSNWFVCASQISGEA